MVVGNASVQVDLHLKALEIIVVKIGPVQSEVMPANNRALEIVPIQCG